MKKTVFIASLLAATALGATGASASGFGGWGPYYPPPPPPPPPADLCTTDRCSPDLADFLQNLGGMQKAINMIVNINDANEIVQEAVNAGNLVNVGDNIDLANVEQNANVIQFATNTLDGDAASFWGFSDLTGISQSATNVANSINSEGLVEAAKQSAGESQFASNAALATFGSTLYDLEQAATNVVNTVTAATSKTVNQVSHTDQVAINFIHGGMGGYDADDIVWDAEDVDVTETQAAVNAANRVTLDSLTCAIKQESDGSQLALNKAIFDGFYGGNVYDFGQSATNVANSVTVAEITPAVFDCLCYDGWEINQSATAGQVASNLLVTVGNVNNTIQSATNIANSINVPTPE